MIVHNILWVKSDLLEGREKGVSIHWILLWATCKNSIHSIFISIVQLLRQSVTIFIKLRRRFLMAVVLLSINVHIIFYSARDLVPPYSRKGTRLQ